MEFINTGKNTTLKDLILSEDVSDNDIIQVWANGRLVARGSWFQDNILGYTDSTGTATESGTRIVDFRLGAKE